MDFPALKEAQAKLTAKRTELKAIFDQAGPDMDMTKVTSVTGDTKAKVDHIRNLNTEIDAQAVEVEGYLAVQKAARSSAENVDSVESGHEQNDSDKPLSFGEMFTKSKAYKDRAAKAEAHLDVQVKTLFQTTAGWLPETTRTGRVVDFATRPIQLLDLYPLNTTSQSAVVYMEETTFTNAAAEAAEGGTYAEGALALTEQSSTVRKVAVWIPVTDEQLEDEAQAQGYLNNRLPFMLRQRLDSQTLVGNGTAPNLRGVLNVVGIQTQAKGADTTPDAVYKALVKVRVTGRATPGAAVFHPNDWQDVRLLRTADGIYIWGSPSEVGQERIWGVPVVQSDAITENTALVGDFANFSELVMRRGIDVQVSNSHDTFFINGKQAVRADLRAAFVVYRPAAFCTVTGI